MWTTVQQSRLRVLRERGMVDACTIRLPGGTPGAFDPGTGSTPITAHAAYYTGACRVRDPSAMARELLSAEQEVTTQAYGVDVPWTVTEVDIGHVVLLTTSRDPWLEGQELLVTSVRGRTFSTGRLLICTLDLG